MTLIPSAIAGAIMAAGSVFPGSQQLPKIATAVGNAIPAWLPSPINVLAQGVTVGVSGSGNVQGKMICFPAGQITAALAAAGLTGINAPLLGTAVEIGVSSAFNSAAQYQGLSVGVSSGTDVSKVVSSNAAALVPILLASLAAVAISGITAAQLATGLGFGISALILSGTGFGGVLPVSPAPYPGAGTSISTLF